MKCPKCGSAMIQEYSENDGMLWCCYSCGHSEKVKHDWNDSFPKYLGEKVKP